MRSLPENVHPYKRTPVFTTESVPAGLLKDHSTREGVWGVIHVQQGVLEYTIEGRERHLLSPGKPGIVEPTIKHHIAPQGPVTFFIEFCKAEE